MMRNDRVDIGVGRLRGQGGLLVLCTALLLGGCGWFDSSGGVAPHLKEVRPGADRMAPVVNSLPPPESSRPHEAGVTPADETGRGGAAVGSTLQGKGGQKAQRDEAEKQAAELSRKAREERAKREAAGGNATPPAQGSPVQLSPDSPPAESAPAPEQPAPSKD